MKLSQFDLVANPTANHSTALGFSHGKRLSANKIKNIQLINISVYIYICIKLRIIELNIIKKSIKCTNSQNKQMMSKRNKVVV